MKNMVYIMLAVFLLVPAGLHAGGSEYNIVQILRPIPGIADSKVEQEKKPWALYHDARKKREKAQSHYDRYLDLLRQADKLEREAKILEGREQEVVNKDKDLPVNRRDLKSRGAT